MVITLLSVRGKCTVTKNEIHDHTKLFTISAESDCRSADLEILSQTLQKEVKRKILSQTLQKEVKRKILSQTLQKEVKRKKVHVLIVYASD